MGDALSRHFGAPVPQTVQARDDQVPNAAGGWGFEVDPMQRALRFLVLGTEGGTYYVSERELTLHSAKFLLELAAERGHELLQLVVDVSLSGRAPKQQPTLFALAACFNSPDLSVRQAAEQQFTTVVRTATHLFTWLGYVKMIRGTGTIVQRAITRWVYSKSAEDLAYQAVKYRSREGWTLRDALRVAHSGRRQERSIADPIADEARRGVLDWVVRGYDGGMPESIPALIPAFEVAQGTDNLAAWQRSIEAGLPWEGLPDRALSEPQVWQTLLRKPRSLPMTALVRNLGRMASLSVGAPLSEEGKVIAARLTDMDALRRARVHPLSLLVAHATYASGHGFRGSMTWTPNPAVTDALERAFYLAFGNVDPSGRRTLMAVDASGSMQMNVCNSPLSARAAAVAMALVTAQVEAPGDTYVLSFTTHVHHQVHITSAMNLRSAMDAVGLTPAGTDCAAPITWATEQGLGVDTFVILTDSETWGGRVHPYAALRQYRQQVNADARLVVVAMTGTHSTIGDVTDAGTLDVVGFDTATPGLIAAFSRGEA